MSKAKRKELESVARVEGGAKTEETKVEEPKTLTHKDWVAQLSYICRELPDDEAHKSCRLRLDSAIKAVAYAGKRSAAAKRSAEKGAVSAESKAKRKEKKLAKIEALKAQIAKMED